MLRCSRANSQQGVRARSSLEGCLQTLEWISIEVSGFAYRLYAPRIGSVQEIELAGDETVQLVSNERPE